MTWWRPISRTGYATDSPPIVTANTRSLSLMKVTSAAFAYAGFGNGLNIHSKWFWRASQLAANTGARTSARMIRPHQRLPAHNPIVNSTIAADATSVNEGDQRRIT